MTIRAAGFSPPDWAFFPGALIGAAAMVCLAMLVRPAGDSPVFADGRYVMEGAALSGLIAAPGAEYAFVANETAPFVRATALASLGAPGGSIGLGVLLPEAFETQAPGRIVAVEASWRAAPNSDLDQAQLRYSTTGGGDSGWRALPVSEAFETVGFCYAVRADAPLTGQEWLGVWPDAEGRGRAIDIQRLSATILPPGATVEACETERAAGWS